MESHGSEPSVPMSTKKGKQSKKGTNVRKAMKVQTKTAPASVPAESPSSSSSMEEFSIPTGIEIVGGVPRLREGYENYYN